MIRGGRGTQGSVRVDDVDVGDAAVVLEVAEVGAEDEEVGKDGVVGRETPVVDDALPDDAPLGDEEDDGAAVDEADVGPATTAPVGLDDAGAPVPSAGPEPSPTAEPGPRPAPDPSAWSWPLPEAPASRSEGPGRPPVETR